ncbi:MAG: hypothetical protein ABII07_02175 [Patescibacteria group bacterium]|nr:hypothetical protein [Patescibacteria group bacterium]
MLFHKAKKLDLQHIALIGLTCGALSLLVIAAMVVLPTFLWNFTMGNSLFFLDSWLVMTIFVLSIAAQVLVLIGPPIYYTVKMKKIDYGMRILFSSLISMMVLLLLVVLVSWIGWGEPYVM